MSALDDLLNTHEANWRFPVMAKDAEVELAALRRVAEAARNHDLMAGAPSNRDGECYFCGGGVMHAVYCDYHKWRTELNAALAEYDKCRAA